MKITFISFCETSLKDYFVSKCNFYSLELYLRQSSPWGLGFGLKRPAGRARGHWLRQAPFLMQFPVYYSDCPCLNSSLFHCRPTLTIFSFWYFGSSKNWFKFLFSGVSHFVADKWNDWSLIIWFDSTHANLETRWNSLKSILVCLGFLSDSTSKFKFFNFSKFFVYIFVFIHS